MSSSRRSSERKSAGRGSPPPSNSSSRWIRIVAGEFRGRRITYNGDPSIRPMKDRTRESVFNLIGGDLTGMLVFDLFAGTGVLGLESLSRGASRAILLELSRTALQTIIDNTKTLNVSERTEIHNVDTLRWFKFIDSLAAKWQDRPWVVFCCPPYEMWRSETERLCAGLQAMYDLSPPGSLFVAETEQDFDISTALPNIEWDVRHYSPAFVGVAEKPGLEDRRSVAETESASDEEE